MAWSFGGSGSRSQGRSSTSSGFNTHTNSSMRGGSNFANNTRTGMTGGSGSSNMQGGSSHLQGYAPYMAGLDGMAGGAFGAVNDAANFRFNTPAHGMVPYTRDSIGGFGMQRNAAHLANPVVQAAANANMGLMNGNNRFLNQVATGNPASSEAFNMGAQGIADHLRGEFAGTGMAGGSRHQKLLGNALGNYGANFAHQAYATDQANALAAAGLQSQAAARAGGVANNLGIGGRMLQGIGGAQEEYMNRMRAQQAQFGLANANMGIDAYGRGINMFANPAATFGNQVWAQQGTNQQNDWRNTDTNQTGRSNDWRNTDTSQYGNSWSRTKTRNDTLSLTGGYRG